MPPILTNRISPAVSRVAGIKWNSRRVFEAEAGVQTDAPKGAQIVPVRRLHTPKDDAEMWTYENADYWEIKIMIAHSQLETARIIATVRQPTDEIVFLLKAVTKVRMVSDRCENAVALFLFDQDHRVAQMAKDTIRIFQSRRGGRRSLLHLLTYERPFTLVGRLSTIEWIDDDSVVCRFRHPQEGFGEVEREFSLADLRGKLFANTPEERRAEIDEGGTFMLEMEQDETGHVVEYLPVAGSYKQGDGPEDPFGGLRLPEDIEDENAMKEYDRKRRAVAEAHIRAAQDWLLKQQH